jgi:hypothetical protein
VGKANQGIGCIQADSDHIRNWNLFGHGVSRVNQKRGFSRAKGREKRPIIAARLTSG